MDTFTQHMEYAHFFAGNTQHQLIEWVEQQHLYFWLVCSTSWWTTYMEQINTKIKSKKKRIITDLVYILTLFLQFTVATKMNKTLSKLSLGHLINIITLIITIITIFIIIVMIIISTTNNNIFLSFLSLFCG